VGSRVNDLQIFNPVIQGITVQVVDALPDRDRTVVLFPHHHVFHSIPSTVIDPTVPFRCDRSVSARSTALWSTSAHDHFPFRASAIVCLILASAIRQ